MARSDSNIPTTHEKSFVEEPFLRQLEAMTPAWQVHRLDRWNQTEAETGRTSWTQPLMLKELEASLLRLNPWLESDQVQDAIRDISFSSGSLIVNNKEVLRLLLEGTSADDRKNDAKGRTVRYIDFQEPKNNTYIAVSEMRFRILGTEKSFFPDIILFINGLPVVVVECKSPKENDAMGQAIDQLMRYCEQRGYAREGSQELFHYNQFIIATCRDIAKAGTITTTTEKYFTKWMDPYPFELDEIPHGETSPNEQQRLVQGMLSPANLLNLLQSFTVFTEDDDGNMIKVVGRYQQFRAVKKTVHRLLTKKNKRERSGIIWHTQGSGKSLTMVFLVREMYRYTQLQSWKIILLTDRTQLDKQLKETARTIGYTINDPANARELKAELRNNNSEIVSAMIHKFQDRDLQEVFPELNIDEKILILTDEAHRSQYTLLGANLDKALPNATRIAFTGTPIEKTKETFGDYIDTYTMRESKEDGVTLQIIYEGRVHSSEVDDNQAMDKMFNDVFADCTISEKLQVISYGTKQSYMEAWPTIRAKAADMVAHYIKQIFPNDFKAQIVAFSKEAAHRYNISVTDELNAIRNHFTATPDRPYFSSYLESYIIEMRLPEAAQEKVRADKTILPSQIDLEKLKELATAVILSAGHNDPPYIQEYANPLKHDTQILSFKTGFGKEKDGVKGNIGIIIVVEMLLTGFDAPVEQVMYLDRMIVAHNLLQAIARVNRSAGANKDCGFIIDYVGVGRHLKQALDYYFTEEDAGRALVLVDEVELHKELANAHKAVWDVLKNSGITDLNDLDALFDVFYDEDLRFKYIEAHKRFVRALNNVFPRKEALDYVEDMLRFAEINVQAGKHLRDSRMSMKGVPQKLRMIADKHLKSRGIEEKVAPISILDERFFEHVRTRSRARTQAAEIEHAIRDHINVELEDDPDLQASFSEALNEIFRLYIDNWEEIRKRLEELRERIRNAQREETYGLSRKVQMPFFRMFRNEIFSSNELTEDNISTLVALTKEIVEKVKLEIALTGFWDRIPMQSKLKGDLQKTFLSQEFGKLPGIFTNYNQIITKVMEIAKKNRDTILYAE